MNTRSTVTAKAVAECGGDVAEALRREQREQVNSLTAFEWQLYYALRDEGASHEAAYDLAVDGPFKEVAK